MTATLLPNAKQQFLDSNGRPLAAGQVYFYIPNTSTLKSTWQDAGKTVANTNPVILDASGQAIIYGDGQYRQVVYDVYGNLIWDKLTDSPALNSDIQGLVSNLASSSGSSLVGFIQPSVSAVARTVQDKLRESVSIFDFIPESEHAAILNYTSTYDCADAIEAAQEYLSPFPWLGSVAATKAGITGGTAKLNFPGGRYRITRTVKLNPYVEFVGQITPFFFGTTGSQIYADFDGRDLFALDTAPWDTTGQRQLGKAWLSTDFDGGVITGCMGQRIRYMRITCASGRNIKGGINVTGAAPFFLEDSCIDGFNIGTKITSSWVGHVRGNFIKARAIGIWTDEGVNQFKSWGNYLGPTGVKPTSTDFDWPTTPIAGYPTATRSFFMSQGWITSDGDTLESWDVNYMTTICVAFRAVNTYIEGTAMTCYVMHDTKGYIQPNNINASSAKLTDTLGKGRTKEIIFELTQMRQGALNIASLGTTSPVNCGITLTGSPNVGIYQTSGFTVPEFDFPNLLNIYVDSTNGNDGNQGYHPSYPVQNLMTAFARCREGCLNVVNLQAGRDYYTTALGGNDWDTFITNFDIRVQPTGSGATPNIRIPYDSGTSRMIPLAFKNCRVQIQVPVLDDVPTNTTVAPGFRALFNLGGLNTLRFTSTATINSQKPFFQSSRFEATQLNLYFDRNTLRSNDGVTNVSLIETDTTYSGKLVWTQIGFGITKIAVVVGSNVNNTKLAATDF